MEAIFQISGLALTAAFLCVLLREQAKTLSMLLSLAASAVGLALAVRFLSPIMSVVEQLRVLSGLSDAATAPMLKVVGIGVLTQVAGSVCEDAGEKALSRVVEITGSCLSVYLSLPLLSTVLSLLEKLLGGGT